LELGAFEEAVCEGQSDENWIRQHVRIGYLLLDTLYNPRMYTFNQGVLVLSLSDGSNMTFNAVEIFPKQD